MTLSASTELASAGVKQIFAGNQLLGSKLRSSSGSVTMEFGYDYTPISKAYPAITPDQYIVKAGDTLQSIAANLYGDASRWYLIADANNLSGSSTLPEGFALKIPNTVTDTRQQRRHLPPL